jgi:cobalt-precorrin-5B (C1)-methyltransferase
MEAATSDACIDILREKGLEEPVMNSLLEAIQKHLSKRAADGVRIGAVLFTNTHGLLGYTQEADAILQKS